jgi:lipopolysaccharide export system protein LptA
VLVVTGFLGYARFRARRFLTELPAKLGVDVRQETNGFTYSQTLKGRTVFTIHAAKAIQHNDGKYTLHDVGIAVYGHGESQGQGDRVDRIYGKEFDLDQAAGVVKAIGEVHLDLQAPAAKDASAKMDYAAGKDLKGTNEAPLHEVGRGDTRLIHVKTNGLVYLRELGVAATDQDIEFEYNGLTGHAKGAEYNADSGLLNLQSAVKVSGLQRGQPILLTASRAEMDRVSRKAVLSQAKYVTVSGEGDGGKARQTVEARRAVVTMRPDNGVERLDGEGDVTVTAGDGLRMVADRGEVLLSTDGKPESAHMMGHVMYTADDATKNAKGGSSEARVSFDNKGLAEKVVLNGDVHLNEHVLPVDAKSGGSDRELNAGMVEVGLVPNPQGRPQPREVKATGDARLKVIDTEKGKESRSSAMTADVLTAKFVPANNGGERLDEVRGSGRTTLERVNEKGVIETSSGDTLQVSFRSSSQKGAASGFEGSEIANALQQGHVVVTRKTPSSKGAAVAEMDRATSESASYDGATQMLTLNGSVQLTNSDGVLWANQVAVEQRTGDASAEGSVKASYKQGSAGAVVHVLAQRAELKKADNVAVFRGDATRPARLWQGGSQVEAPVLEFNQKQRRLVARGEGAGAPMVVHTVLVSTGPAGGKPISQSSSAAKGSPVLRGSSVVRVASREMVYSDETRTADFTGGVRVESADGVMRGDRATAYLEASASQKQGGAGKNILGKTDSGAAFLGGDLERVVVSSGIEIDQPGRRATGDKLVYTAADGLFVLTGSPASPSRVVDQARGTVIGIELRFHSEDESVVISNGDKGGTGLRVHTETRVKKER